MSGGISRAVVATALTSVFILSIFAVQFVFAHEEDLKNIDEATIEAGAPIQLLPNTVSCFDHYSFGSVQADLNTSVSSVVSGTPVVFSGTLYNGNPYPVVDGTLYVKIFRETLEERNINGHDVIDQFVAIGDISIPAYSSVPVTFSWNVPAFLVSGDYQLATYFMTSRKFNLSGLSFTDDVIGNSVHFSVSGEQQGSVHFDKSEVSVDGSPYSFAAFPPRVGTTSPVRVSSVIRNDSAKAQKALVNWVVYQWDAQLRENVVQEQTSEVSVEAGGTASVSITVQDSRYPVYLVTGTLVWKDTKSIINVRFVREGLNRTRINFPSISSYPLLAGQENTIFSCLHNSGASEIVPNSRLEISLSDTVGNVIHSYTYRGDVSGDMMGVADTFVPERNYDRFVLDARLYNGDEFVDEAHLEYDCERLRPEDCSPRETFGGETNSFFDFILSDKVTWYALLLAVFVVLGTLIALRSHKLPPQP